MLLISVIVCTYNRCAWLPGLFSSLAAQTLPAAAFEIVVVDNNSTDATRTVIDEQSGGLPNLRYLFEAEQGLSIARNRGLREAAAPLVVYVDDDAIATPGWLEAIITAFADNEAIVCVGGPVELDWQGERPTWLPPRYESLYTCVDHGDRSRLLTQHEYLVGANISFRREWLQDIGGFSTDLGRKGSCLLSGEEAQVYQAVFTTGRQVRYAPTAKIWHRVTPERKCRRWFYRRLFWDGATQPLLDTGAGERPAVYLRGAWYDARRSLRFALEMFFGFCQGDRSAGYDAQARLLQRLGRFWMHLRLAAGKGL